MRFWQQRLLLRRTQRLLRPLKRPMFVDSILSRFEIPAAEEFPAIEQFEPTMIEIEPSAVDVFEPPGLAEDRPSSSKPRNQHEQRDELKKLLDLLLSKATICSTCGVQHTANRHDSLCCICYDVTRNAFRKVDQMWISHQDVLENLNPVHRWDFLEPNLLEIQTSPTIFLGQRSFLIKSKSGNVLWDCICPVDMVTVNYINKIGGVKAIVISNPEHMATFTIWSSAFNNCPVYIHSRDSAYMTLPLSYIDSHIIFWRGETYELWDDISVINLGGHYDGSCILHRKGYGGFILSSNTLKVGADRMSVSVMKSYRNFIPANPATVLRMFQIMLRLDLDYERVYGSLPGDDIKAMGKQIVMSSLREYLMWSCREKELEEPWSTSKSV
ncbi:hypothetical protein MPTK1_4g07370 [Marchantia polymorpha subsp. ruderalis]|uniref:Metallo-beta-lactamase domain-containing protein n=2 Tax=Marchantia polymorpha TaxID=3197 RepID=A0AAF6B7E3_MARPO|nr:hypothetical protein MARPO_0115s0044 [Marchantia polymorpha]BBN07927.1 hypothetical protein Mp_4g07370 [Marchantia polymorpha subsp. ruderalis]|eukprot:PTQ31127.1 hypothetical protein MARPO_0115s0044 [Marchantia polymorpha]